MDVRIPERMERRGLLDNKSEEDPGERTINVISFTCCSKGGDDLIRNIAKGSYLQSFILKSLKVEHVDIGVMIKLLIVLYIHERSGLFYA